VRSDVDTVHPSINAAPTMASRWPLERLLFAIGGSMTLLSALLAATVSPWFLLLAALVGINQWSYVMLSACPASLLLERLGAERRCRWDE
jgi:hypothetical protein